MTEPPPGSPESVRRYLERYRPDVVPPLADDPTAQKLGLVPGKEPKIGDLWSTSDASIVMEFRDVGGTGKWVSVECPLCGESTTGADDRTPIGTPEGRRPAHRECLLRSVLGGIGHLTDHNYWCNEMHDPDGGLTYRQSALGVDSWVHEHGQVAP